MARSVANMGYNGKKIVENNCAITNNKNSKIIVGNEENSQKNDNFDLIGYLTGTDNGRFNSLSFDKNTQTVSSRASLKQLPQLPGEPDKNQKCTDRNSDCNYLEWLCRPPEKEEIGYNRKRLVRNNFATANNEKKSIRTIDNKENVLKNTNTDSSGYLTDTEKGRINSLRFDKKTRILEPRASFEQLSDHSGRADKNKKCTEQDSSFDYLEWLCSPSDKEDSDREAFDSNSLNLSIDSFMGRIMNPLVQKQYNISMKNFDDIMNSFLSFRTSGILSKDEVVFEQSPKNSQSKQSPQTTQRSPKIGGLSQRSAKKQSKAAHTPVDIPIVLPTSEEIVFAQQQASARTTRNSQRSNISVSSQSSGKSVSNPPQVRSLLQRSTKNESRTIQTVFDMPIFSQDSSIQTPSNNQRIKRKTVEKSKDLSVKKRRQTPKIDLELSLKCILIPHFETNISRFNCNWISYIASITWLETCLKDNITTNRKLIKQNIFIDDFRKESSTRSMNIRLIRKGKLKIYKLQYLSNLKHPNQDLDVDSLFQVLSQNENMKIQPETVHNLSSNLNDSQLSQDSVDSVLSMSQQTLRNGLNQICQNEDGGNQDHGLNRIGKLVVLSRIQEIFVKIFQAFQDNKIPCLNVRHREYKNCVFKDCILQLKPVGQATSRIINYNTNRSHSKFCLIIYLMAKIYQLIEYNTKLTKREIFYQIKHLIKNQTQIADALDEISCLLNVGIWELNIVSQKGLVYGDLKVVFSSGETLDCNVPGTLIPFNVDEIVEIRSRAYFILIVEKESIFHKLIAENLPNKMTRPFLMITGKGYPNLFTQLFVNKLWRIMSVPVFILVDPDPYGIHIMLNYRFGSLNNSHISEELAIPKARWLGVFPSEIIKLGIKTTPTSIRDRNFIKNLISSPYMGDHPRIKRELEVLLGNNSKASIEGLIKTNKFLSSSYLPTKFVNCDFI